jgi:hypothetical protein
MHKWLCEIKQIKYNSKLCFRHIFLQSWESSPRLVTNRGRISLQQKVNVFEKMQDIWYVQAQLVRCHKTAVNELESARRPREQEHPCVTSTHLRTFTHQPRALLKHHFATNFSSLYLKRISPAIHFYNRARRHIISQRAPASEQRWENRRKKVCVVQEIT